VTFADVRRGPEHFADDAVFDGVRILDAIGALSTKATVRQAAHIRLDVQAF